MTDIKEVGTLNTIASIRRAAQESMRPIIQQIENKMCSIENSMKQISKQIVEFTGIDKKMQKNEQSNRYLHGQLLQLSDSFHHSELQMEIDRQKMEKIDQNFKDEIRRLHRLRQKQELTIHNFQVKNEQALKEVGDYLKTMKSKQLSMQARFHKIVESSESFKLQVNKNNEDMKLEFQQMKNTLNFQLKQSSRRLQLLDMYEADKQLNFQRFSTILSQLQSFIKVPQFEYYKQCNSKEQQAVIESVKKILEENLSEDTRELISELPHFRQELKHCLKFESSIQKVQQNVTQIESTVLEQTLNNKNEKDIEGKYVRDIFAKMEKRREQMEKNIQEALALEGLISNKIYQYSDILKAQLRAENDRKNKQLYNQIKTTFADTREAMREKELQRIVEERNKLFDRCEQVESIGTKIHHILSNYSSKFTKIRSDNELFQERVNKELEKLEELRTGMASNNKVIGKTLSEIIEAILTTYCIDIDIHSHAKDEILLTTLNDGVIYQKFTNNYKNGYLMYRRKLMDPEVLRRAMAFSLLELYDELMSENCCLKWHELSPSDFFKNIVEPIYINLNDKKEVQGAPRKRDTIDLSTIQPRQTISDFDYHSRNITTMREKRNRYSSFESGQIFKHKSTRRVRGALNSSLGMN